MRSQSWFILALALLAACADERGTADLLLHGGRIYTQDPATPWVEAMVVSHGRIEAMGDDEAIQSRYQARETADLQGRFVMPGFVDAHVHPLHGGFQLLQCDLSAATSVEALLDVIRGCHEADPGGGWLIGGGWDLSLFAEANPSRTLLDAIAPERPLFLQGADGHSSWVNTRALAEAGIAAETPDPPNGVIERDATGAPSGTLRESAQSLVQAVLPAATDADRDAALARGLEVLAEHGITTVIDAAVGSHEWAAYQRFAAAGRLTVRVNASLAADGPMAPAGVDPMDVAGHDPWLRRGAVKIFVDGVLEGQTAALLEPYASGRSGALHVPAADLARQVTALDAAGAQVHMHAIGDAAVRAALDAVAAAVAANGPRDRRHHIAHLQLVHPADIPRFAELGVAANFQSLWAFPDRYITDVNLPAVGQERVDRMYPIGSLHRASARLVGGSDWPVSSIDPLDAIEVAVTRQDPIGAVPGVLNASERIDLATAIAMYTQNAAWLTGREDEIGSFAPGKLADLIVLDRNPFEIPASELSEVRVTATWVGGRKVR